VRHVPDGVLRRLDDEPLAVPDRVTEHLAGCPRCTARRAHIVGDTEHAARLFTGGPRAPDTDMAWARLRRELRREPGEDRAPRPRRVPNVRPRNRLPRMSLRTGLAIGAAGVVIAGTAAAASLTTIFAPTHVVPVSLSQGDLRAVSSLVGLDGGQGLGGFATPDGSSAIRFGRLQWSSSGPGHPVASGAQASADAGFPVPLPARLPAGVGALHQLAVQPRVTATVTFNASAPGLAGSSVTLNAGPAVMAEYGGRAAGGDVPALGVATMRRPTATSTGASLSQIEAFLLGQPGIPAGVAEEVRLLGDLRTIFPVPVPPGATVRSVRVGGWPGVLLTDSSHAASAVVWEDGRGLLHVVAGILDPQDVLNVAAQVG
jgi:hypothetical protein